jgi:phosphoribosylformylglycinamidine synthase
MRFGVIRFPGSCDEVDALLAAQRVGEAVILWHGDRDLHGVDAVIVPGGFSYGLLPGALLTNVSLRFICRQVELEVVHADTAFTRACDPGARLSIPVKHTTGCFYAPEEELDRLEAAGQVLLRYAPGQNPNGSIRDIAGVRNERGNVFGLMPHPEHAVDPLTGSSDGLKVFESMRAQVADRVLA